MKMDVDQKLVGMMPTTLINNLLNSIDEQDWYSSDYRRSIDTMVDCNSIPIFHTPLCATGQCDMGAIKSIRKELMYDKFFPLVEPILEVLRNYYEFRQYSCFLSRLAPGGVIGMHPDRGNFLELCHRVHIPLKSNPEVHYVIDDKSYYWEPGKVYEFDNTRLHGVFNESKDYRIHLVVNLYNLSDEQLNEK
jgi:hypothetical protein